MARRWITSNGTNVIEHTVAKIAIDGIIQPITAALVVNSGINRQFWPPASSPTDPRITLTTDPVTITRRQIDPDNSFAQLNVNRFWGFATYANFPQADGNFPCLNPGLDGTAGDDGKYLIRVNQTSGFPLQGPLATWIDINSLADHVWQLDRFTPGSDAATADLLIAQDDGIGLPVIATIVVKPLTFSSTVLATTDITWTTVQHDLVENTESVDADVSLTFNPEGFAVGSADTSGAFNEDWNIDSPAVPNPALYTVRADLISGTAPAGSALGTLLDLALVHEWTLSATTGETLACELDVTVDNLIPLGNLVSKRVTMSVSRGTPLPDPDWTIAPWTCTDAGFPQPISSSAVVTLTFAADGTAKLEMESTVMGLTEFNTGTWFTGFSGDLNDYECMLDNINGGGITSGQTQGVWVRMDEVFTVEFITKTNLRNYIFNANVRKVGGLTTTKPINVTLIAGTGQPV